MSGKIKVTYHNEESQYQGINESNVGHGGGTMNTFVGEETDTESDECLHWDIKWFKVDDGEADRLDNDLRRGGE
jgi:hypothetical protein